MVVLSTQSRIAVFCIAQLNYCINLCECAIDDTLTFTNYFMENINEVKEWFNKLCDTNFPNLSIQNHSNDIEELVGFITDIKAEAQRRRIIELINRIEQL